MARAAVWFLSVCFLSVWGIVSCTSCVDAQELVNKGILVTQIRARTRMEMCERGDLVHVTVRQPARSQGFTLSVHAEYANAAGKWLQVPPPKSMIGPWYTSLKYRGLRDWAEANGVSEATERNIALFIPFDGFALQQGQEYDFRYVLRLWNETDKEIASLALEPYRVRVDKDSDGTRVSIVNAKSYGFPKDSAGASAAHHHPAGVIRFFDTATGKWERPDVASDRTTLNR